MDKTTETKKFYSVKYAVWGADETIEAWFDTKEKAYAFYNGRDYVDKPKEHKYSDLKKIAQAQELCDREEVHRNFYN